MSATITFDDVRAAAARIAPYIHTTPVLHAGGIDQLAHARLVFKCENFQRAGAFKFRGASNAIWSLSDATAACGVVTHSSGNHGAALALAARTRGISAHVVVPENTVESKISAIRRYGASVHLCAPTLEAREETAERVRRETGATLVHPFTNPAVIAGQGTATLELIEQSGPVDALIAPVSGGGLISGNAIAAHGLSPGLPVFAAEPEGAADAFESMRRGERVTDVVAHTICDGLRANIGAINFELMRAHAITVLPVSDEETIAAMRMIWERMKIVVEASSATVLAAALRHNALFAGKRVGLILTGGNVDLDNLPWGRKA